MMATIIELSDGSCIAGDPLVSLGLGEHWCGYCGGDGLEYDFDGELTICMGCFGACVVQCEDTACIAHSTLHPLPHDSYSVA